MNDCHLVDRYLDHSVTEDERVRFEAHLADCAACRRRVEEWHNAADRLRSWAGQRVGSEPSAADTHKLIERAEQALTPPRQIVIPKWTYGLAAAAAAAIIIILFWNPAEEIDDIEKQPTFATRTMEPPELQEPVIWLRAASSPLKHKLGSDQIAMMPGSSARIPKTTAEQTVVELVDGTVVCQVAPQRARRTFTVHAGRVAVRVKGTAFSVTRGESPGDVTVVVARGTVEARLEEKTIEVGTGQKWHAAGGAVETALQQAEPAEIKTITELVSNSSAQQEAEAHSGPEDPSKSPVAKSRPRREEHAERAPGEKAAAADYDLWRQWIIAGQLGKAQHQIAIHLEKDHDDAAAWNLLADTHRKAGGWKQSTAAYEKAIEYSKGPKANRARYMAATIYQKHLGEHPKAIAHLEDYLKSSNQGAAQFNVAKVNLARSLAQVGQKQRAIVLLEEVIRAEGSSIVASNARKLLQSLQSN